MVSESRWSFVWTMITLSLSSYRLGLFFVCTYIFCTSPPGVSIINFNTNITAFYKSNIDWCCVPAMLSDILARLNYANCLIALYKNHMYVHRVWAQCEKVNSYTSTLRVFISLSQLSSGRLRSVILVREMPKPNQTNELSLFKLLRYIEICISSCVHSLLHTYTFVSSMTEV